MSKKVRSWILMIVIAVGIALIPAPEGMDPKAMWFLGMFISLVVGFILQPLPAGALTFLVLTLCAVLKVCTLKVAIAGWGSKVAWLVMSAFIIAKGFSKTGLGRRMSLIIVKAIGTSTLKLGYAFSISELVIGPAIPSYTARSGGVIYPIQIGICEFFDSKPGETANRCGNYFMQLEHQMTNIVAAMFLTSSAINPLGISIVKDITGIDISWPQWAMMCVIPGLVLVLTVPFIMYKMTKPTITKTPEAPKLAADLLAKLGPMSTGEKWLLAVFIGCIFLWATSVWTKVDATAVALLGCSVLVLTDTVTWKEALSNYEGWTSMLTIGGLTALSGLFTELGVINWLVLFFNEKLAGVPTIVVFYGISKENPVPSGTKHASMAPYQTFKTKNGKLIMGMSNETQFKRFCTIKSFEKLAQNPHYDNMAARVANRDALADEIEEVFLEMTTKEVAAMLDEYGIPNSPINTMKDLFEDEYIYNELMMELDFPEHGKFVVPRFPLVFSDKTPMPKKLPPMLGEDNDQVLVDYGFTESEIAELKKCGAV